MTAQITDRWPPRTGYTPSDTPARQGDVWLHWQQGATGVPEYVAVRDGVELGRIRLDGGAYWVRPASGDPRPVLFTVRSVAVRWLASGERP